jgi:hypothetical protein
MITSIRIYFFTKTEPICLESTDTRKIVNACERGSFYAVLFDDGDYLQFPIQHIFKIVSSRVKVDRTNSQSVVPGQRPEWLERVIAERDELKTRLDKLTSFILGPLFLAVEESERDRLKRQESYMAAYLYILNERIEHFGDGLGSGSGDGQERPGLAL